MATTLKTPAFTNEVMVAAALAYSLQNQNNAESFADYRQRHCDQGRHAAILLNLARWAAQARAGEFGTLSTTNDAAMRLLIAFLNPALELMRLNIADNKSRAEK